MSEPGFVQPAWPAPSGVRALSTTRLGGVSTGPYASFNLGRHVGDEPAAVSANRARLRQSAGLPDEPVWLDQQHGIEVLNLDNGRVQSKACRADAAVASGPGLVCAVLTADCLPVLLTDHAGSRVGAVHAGWRGLAAGVVEQAVAAMAVPAAELIAWLGPCIGVERFEVGPEVRDALLASDNGASAGFRAGLGDRWHTDLQALARRRLISLGVASVTAAVACTFEDSQRFFSFRRDGSCGRMATLIWRE